MQRDVAVCSLRAMVHHKLGRSEEVRTALVRAADLAKAKLRKPGSEKLGESWENWIIAHMLLREAQALIGATPAASQSGEQVKK